MQQAAEREAADAGRRQALALRTARALAARACANPRCTNVRGASEARLRGRRCGGCGVARYCCRECAVAAWPEHSAVCAQLGAGGG